MSDPNKSCVREVRELRRMARLRSTGEPVQLRVFEFRVVRNGEEVWLPSGEVTLREIEMRIVELRRQREALDQQREALDCEIEKLSAPLQFVLTPDDEEYYELEGE